MFIHTTGWKMEHFINVMWLIPLC